MKKPIEAKSSAIDTNPAAYAHMTFSMRVMGLRNKADKESKEFADEYASSNAVHLRNKAYISTGEAQGLKEAFHKLYINGDQTEGVAGVFRIQGNKPVLSRELTKSQMRKALQAIQASMNRVIDELSAKITKQSYKALTTPESSPQHATVQRKVLTLHGQLLGTQKVLVEFQKCYRDLM